MSTMDNLIRDYLIQVGCKVEYPILVNAFKKHLYNPDPEIQKKVRTQFKDCVNRLSTVNVENNMKFITLREEFRPSTNQQQEKKPSPPLRQKNMPPPPSQPATPMKPPITPSKQINEQYHRTPSSAIMGTINQPPPPPRMMIHQRSYSEQSNNGTPVMIQSHQHSRDHPDSPRSLQPIDTLRRRWTIEACNCNHNNLLALLREDPKLALCKDILNGYTAVHWAAKFGSIDIIKMIAGSYRQSVNVKSNAGHTPLHIAYIYNRIEVVNLLLDSYQASSNIRDHSGKKPMQYWKKSTSLPY